MDTGIDRPCVDHDSRCRLLLLWSPPEEERPLHDLLEYDVLSGRLIRGEFKSFDLHEACLTRFSVVLLGFLTGFLRDRFQVYR